MFGLPPDSGIIIEFHASSVPPLAKNCAFTEPPEVDADDVEV